MVQSERVVAPVWRFVPWVAIDFLLVWMSYALALAVRGLTANLEYAPALAFAFLASVIAVACNEALGRNWRRWRFARSPHVVPLTIAVGSATVAIVGLNLAWPGFRPMPLSVVFLGGFFAFSAMAAVRTRLVYDVTRTVIIWMCDVRLVLAASIVVGVSVTLRPVFRERVPTWAGPEFVAHVGAVTAAVSTWHETHALPISSSEIRPDIEYPYILLGNTAFYLISAFFSVVLGVPAYIGAGLALMSGFALAACSVFFLARRAGLNAYLSIALGFLYAAGPYLCLNLFVRNAFPEYLTWQVAPALLLVVRWAFRSQAGPLAMLAGALALAAPFYFHKLVAPHLALTLAVLGVNSAPWRARTVPRLALIGTLSLLFSVPGWYPSVRGLAEDTVRHFVGGGMPAVFHRSLADLFWPYAVDTLPAGPRFDFYEGRFALQAGLVSLAGIAIALGTLVSQPRLAWTQRLPLPIVLYAFDVVLIMGWLRVWEFAPSPLKYVQFSYRLLGLVHFLGFILLIQALGGPGHLARRAPVVAQRIVAVLFVTFAGVGAATYWHTPPLTAMRSDEIRPPQLGELDRCSFCPPTPWSGMTSLQAIGPEQALVVPPVPMAIPAGATPPSIVLDGNAPDFVFDGTSGDLVVRIYGFAKTRPEARLEELGIVLAASATEHSSAASVSALYDVARQTPAADAVADADVVLWPGGSWTARELAETTLTRAGRFDMHAPLDGSIAAIAIECGRGVLSNRGLPAGATPMVRCVDVTALAPPNLGDDLAVPKELPRRAWTRGAMGQIQIEASDLEDGLYLVPTFDYAFVRVADSDGSLVPTSHFNRQPVIEHTGSSTAYTVSYDFQPELLAVLAGVLIFLVSALAMRLRRPVAGRIVRLPSIGKKASTSS